MLCSSFHCYYQCATPGAIYIHNGANSLWSGIFFEKYSINCLFRSKYDNSSKKISNSKGQIISKSLFGVFNFIQKTNKNTLHTFKNEFIFGKNSQLDKINRPLKRILFRMSFLFIIVSYNLNRKFYMTKIHQNLILINGSTIGPLKMVNKYI